MQTDHQTHRRLHETRLFRRRQSHDKLEQSGLTVSPDDVSREPVGVGSGAKIDVAHGEGTAAFEDDLTIPARKHQLLPSHGEDSRVANKRRGVVFKLQLRKTAAWLHLLVDVLVNAPQADRSRSISRPGRETDVVDDLVRREATCQANERDENI